MALTLGNLGRLRSLVRRRRGFLWVLAGSGELLWVLVGSCAFWWVLVSSGGFWWGAGRPCKKIPIRTSQNLLEPIPPEPIRPHPPNHPPHNKIGPNQSVRTYS